jgi:hypothetical protein
MEVSKTRLRDRVLPRLPGICDAIAVQKGSGKLTTYTVSIGERGTSVVVSLVSCRVVSV